MSDTDNTFIFKSPRGQNGFVLILETKEPIYDGPRLIGRKKGKTALFKDGTYSTTSEDEARLIVKHPSFNHRNQLRGFTLVSYPEGKNSAYLLAEKLPEGASDEEKEAQRQERIAELCKKYKRETLYDFATKLTGIPAKSNWTEKTLVEKLVDAEFDFEKGEKELAELETESE